MRAAKAPKKVVDPMHIFVAAEQFWKVAQQLHASTELIDVGMATCANSAFALELYFKCLLADDGKTLPQTHDLRHLFNHMSRKTQLLLESNFQPHLAGAQRNITLMAKNAGLKIIPVVSFDYLLDISRNAFPNMRYFFESIGQWGEGWAADGIMRSARKTILDMHPTWETHRLVSPVVHKSKDH